MVRTSKHIAKNTPSHIITLYAHHYLSDLPWVGVHHANFFKKCGKITMVIPKPECLSNHHHLGEFPPAGLVPDEMTKLSTPTTSQRTFCPLFDGICCACLRLLAGQKWVPRLKSPQRNMERSNVLKSTLWKHIKNPMRCFHVFESRPLDSGCFFLSQLEKFGRPDKRWARM